ncbi:IS3 family transposase [Ureibacillus chungkukjangi]|uniref:IS3 family transposase n=2 Tax=Ureibacillus chungkukjangi TaxID=1202712 RepID=UPI00187D2186
MSMSHKGMPADNASIESFHSSLKSETFNLDGLTCTTTAIVEQTVRDYITYYNNTRIQTKLDCHTQAGSPINHAFLIHKF